MVFDSQQQKETVFQFMQMVRIDAPYQVARQQIIQLDDMIQAVVAAEIAPPAAPSAPDAPTTPQVQPEAPKTSK